MKKKCLWLFTILFFILTVFAFAGCGIRIVRQIEVKEDIVYETEVGGFDYSAVTIVVHYSDKSFDEVTMTEEMLPASERIKLFKIGEQTLNVNYLELTCKLKIKVLRKNFSSDIYFENKTETYDGKMHSITVSGDIPEQATIMYPNGNSYVDAGTYNIVANIYSEGYEAVELSATLVIEKADYDISGVNVKDAEFVYDGTAKSSAIENLPNDIRVNVSYYTSDGKIRVDTPVSVGDYLQRVRFSCLNDNYNAIPDKIVNLKINPATYDMSEVRFNDSSVTYDNLPHFITIANTYSIPRGVSVEYKYVYYPMNTGLIVKDKGNVVEEPINAGRYLATAKFTSENTNYNEIPDMTAWLIINPKDVNLSYMRLDSGYATFDGQSHSLELLGELPETIKVTTYYNGVKTDSVVRAGVYDVVVRFTYVEEGKDSKSYNLIPSQLNAKFSVDRISETIELPEGSLVYNDEAGEGEDKFILNNVPEGVNADVEFSVYNSHKEVVKVPANELERGNVYQYVIKFTYMDADKEASVDRNEISGSKFFKYLIPVSNIWFGSQTVIYDGEEHSVLATIEGENVPDDLLIYSNNSFVDAGLYTIIASINKDLYEIKWLGDVFESDEYQARLTIEKATTTIEFTEANIGYDDESTNAKYYVKDMDLTLYKFDIEFRDPVTSEVVFSNDLKRDNEYDYTVKAYYVNDITDRNYQIKDITGTKYFKILYSFPSYPMDNATLTYTGKNIEYKYSENGIPADAFIYTHDELTSVGSFIIDKNETLCTVFVKINMEKYDFKYEAALKNGKEITLKVEKTKFIFDKSAIVTNYKYDGEEHGFETTQEIPDSVQVNAEFKLTILPYTVSDTIKNVGKYTMNYYATSDIYDCGDDIWQVQVVMKFMPTQEFLKDRTYFYTGTDQRQAAYDLFNDIPEGMSHAISVWKLTDSSVDTLIDPGTYRVTLNLFVDHYSDMWDRYYLNYTIIDCSIPENLKPDYVGKEGADIKYTGNEQYVDLSNYFSSSDVRAVSNVARIDVDCYVDEFTISSKSRSFDSFTVELKYYIISERTGYASPFQVIYTGDGTGSGFGGEFHTVNFVGEIISKTFYSDASYYYTTNLRSISPSEKVFAVIEYRYTDGREATFRGCVKS